MRPLAMLAIGFSLLLGAGCGKPDKDAIQGTWTVESLEADGRQAPANEIKDQKFLFTADKATLDDGRRKNEQPYKIDPDAKPKTIDVTETRQVGFGPGERDTETKTVTQTMKGIYSLDGDTLTICFGRPEADRPTAFAGKKGQVLFVLKRAK